MGQFSINTKFNLSGLLASIWWICHITHLTSKAASALKVQLSHDFGPMKTLSRSQNHIDTDIERVYLFCSVTTLSQGNVKWTHILPELSKMNFNATYTSWSPLIIYSWAWLAGISTSTDKFIKYFRFSSLGAPHKYHGKGNSMLPSLICVSLDARAWEWQVPFMKIEYKTISWAWLNMDSESPGAFHTALLCGSQS